ncbi:uncharacterized protein LOC108733073 [Agrilus planipennis]|uniref:Uncharacterized protein LOC108733073 n=1 Tax=Agrilus planipennis TaxID=224129 RepID=A0A1W4WGM9_AGRPL|nr:uncharacterized protein LOC108733073 [Agrilus planipennis]
MWTFFVSIFVCGVCFAERIQYATAMPVEVPEIERLYPPVDSPRPFFNSIGDLIGSTGFLPIEINVPDTITNLINGIQSISGGNPIGNGVILNSLVQRFPFLQNFRPRPNASPYIFLILPNPNRKWDNGNIKNALYPFDPNSEEYSMFYP